MQTASVEEDLFQYLSLMARVHLATFCQFVDGIKASNRIHDKPDWKLWYRLRVKLDIFQDDIRAFSRYIRRESDNSVLQEQLEGLREDQEDLCAKAQSLETFLRDRLQAVVGIKSLEESRTSIEEGKRVKLSKPRTFDCLNYQLIAYHVLTVTTLAFIFIPTNLASSICGMNVQEIDNTGKGIWNFIVTAVSMTGTAVAVLLLSNLAQAK